MASDGSAGSAGSTLTIADIEQSLGATLDLKWYAHQAGANRSLDSSDDDDQPVPLVGYLNLIRPPQIQIVGHAELTYLQSTDSLQYAHALSRITSGDTAAIIAAGGCQLNKKLLDALYHADIAVLSSTLPGHKIAYHLGHFLGRTLARQITIHGVFLEILSLGVLITGKPGVGKSELALELINRGHSLVADDAPEFLLLGPGDLNGGCPPLLQDFLEVRGLGILDIRAMFGEAAIKRRKQLGLIIHLVRHDKRAIPAPDRLAGDRRAHDILEVKIPEITLPVAAGHNLSVLVEAACRDHLLRMQGYRSNEAFAQRQASSMQGSIPCS